MLKRLTTFLLVALMATLPCVARASGVINEDGYVATDDGMYLLPSSGTLYTRNATTAWYWVEGTPGYYYTTNCCRYWYPGMAGYWQSYTKYAYTAVQINAAAPNAEELLIKAFAARDKAVLALAKESQRQGHVRSLASELGLNAAISNYGAGIFPVANYGQLITSTAVNGTTVYGYNPAFQTLTLDVKGVDDTVLAQALAQVAVDLPKYVDSTNARLERQLEQRAAINGRSFQTAVIGLAAAQLAQASGKAVQPKPDLSLSKTTPVYPPVPVKGENIPVEPEPAPSPTGVKFLALAGPSQCVRCHGAGKPAQEHFDLTRFNPTSAADTDVDRVLAYIDSPDPKASCGTASGRTKLDSKMRMQFIRGR